jgi:hypothetical protein
LENNSGYDKLAESIRKKVMEKYGDNIPERFQQLFKYIDLGEVLIIKSKFFISIYDETNSFETIQNKVKDLSTKMDYPILYTSNFDDGVFLLGAYKSGKLITSGNMGPELSVYGMKTRHINISKLCNALQLEKTEAFEAINSMEEIDEIEQVVEEFLHSLLDLDFNSVASDTEYEEMFSKNRFRVFNKV